MEYLLTYLVVGTSICFLAISYKFDRPALTFISGLLLFVLGLGMVYTDLQVPIGQIVTANSSVNVNLTTYNFTNTYSNLTTVTGIQWNYWSYIFLFVGLYFILEGMLRLTRKPNVND